MKAFEYAMKMELDGKKFYTEQAGRMADPVLRQIYEELADDEERHYRLFKAMMEGDKISPDEAFRTGILATTKNVFQKLKKSGADIGRFPRGVIEAWEKARELEDQVEKFYREQATRATEAGEKKIWNQIADEEHKHWVAINHVVDFVNRPNQWLEDAEWSHLEDY